MEFKYFSRNGEILPIEKAAVPLSSIEYAYGFGVYESIRVSNGVLYFVGDHIGRLMESARIIGLAHTFSVEMIAKAITEVLEKNAAASCNVKILLVGGRTPEDASLDILCLNPLFPDKKLYRDGVQTITYEYERAFPHAKTLNMLQSYLAYRKAKEASAYDALLVDAQGRIREGTRTNFLCIKDKSLFSPKEEDILLGVTRKLVLKVAAEKGYELIHKDIRFTDLHGYDGAFLTSTSSKILPIRTVDDFHFGKPADALEELVSAFDVFLRECGGKCN